MRVNKLESVAVFLLIATSGGVFSVSGTSFIFNIAFILVVLVLFFAKRLNLPHITKAVGILSLILCAAIILPQFQLDKQDYTECYYFLLRLLTIVIFVSIYTKRESAFIDLFYNVMTYILIVTLIVYLLSSLYPMESLLFRVSQNLRAYLGVFILYGNAIFKFFNFKRVSGIFYEPGIFQVYINAYICILLFHYKLNRKNIYLFFIAVFLLFCTFSVVGYLIFLGILILFSCKKSKLLALILVCLLLISTSFLLSLKASNGVSYALRTSEFEMILHNVSIFGHGINCSQKFNFIVDGEVIRREFSNSYFSLMIQLGVFGVLVFLVIIVSIFLKLIARKKWVLCGIFFLLLVALSSEMLITSNMMLFLFLMLLNYNPSIKYGNLQTR